MNECTKITERLIVSECMPLHVEIKLRFSVLMMKLFRMPVYVSVTKFDEWLTKKKQHRFLTKLTNEQLEEYRFVVKQMDREYS